MEGALERAAEVMFEDVRRRVLGSGADEAEGVGGGNGDGDGGEGEGRGSGRSEEEGEKPRLANMLPELAKWAHSALNTVPNELVDVRVFFSPFCTLSSFFFFLFVYFIILMLFFFDYFRALLG